MTPCHIAAMCDTEKIAKLYFNTVSDRVGNLRFSDKIVIMFIYNCLLCILRNSLYIINFFHRAALDRATVLLSMSKGGKRIDNVWGSGGGQQSVKHLVKEVINTQWFVIDPIFNHGFKIILASSNTFLSISFFSTPCLGSYLIIQIKKVSPTTSHLSTNSLGNITLCSSSCCLIQRKY